MMQRLQRGAVEHSYPQWVRLLAMVCLLLVGGASTAQAAHIHGQWLPQHAAHASQPASATQTQGGEEHCGLCMAMHAALPVAMRVEPVRLALVARVAIEAEERAAASSWFSRPPPAVDFLQ
jgi:hypothetical protein